MGVSTMVIGEKSRFIVRSEYGYGRCPPESLPKIFPGDSLDFEIELIALKPPIPRFPSQEELAQSKKEREEEAREEMKNNPPVPYADRCKEALEEKDKGNVLFAAGKYEEAKKAYDSGMIHIFIHKDEWNACLKPEHKKMINDVKAVLHLNRSACRIKMGNWEDALWDSSRSIEFGPGNAKAHYRRMVVYTGQLGDELEKEKKGIFWDVEKVSGRSERALRKTRILAMDLAKWLQTATPTLN